MKASVRGKLDMAMTVRDFSWAHPCSATRYIAATDWLAERIARAETLARQPISGICSRSDVIAELDSVLREIGGLVLQIDAINEFRFRADPESLGAWRRTKNSAWPLRPAA